MSNAFFAYNTKIYSCVQSNVTTFVLSYVKGDPSGDCFRIKYPGMHKAVGIQPCRAYRAKTIRWLSEN